MNSRTKSSASRYGSNDCFSPISKRNALPIGIALACAMTVSSQVNAACHVNASAAAGGDGLSWTSAYDDLQSALKNVACTEIWVAKGIYKPTPDPNPTVSFNIRSGVAVYGGFNGTETSRDDRDPASNVTVLSGDVDSNDAHAKDSQIDVTPADIVGQNTHHIVTFEGTSKKPITLTTVLDGFVINGGSATDDGEGGGMYCDGHGAANECSPTLKNLIFSANTALEGGAVFNDGEGGTSNPQFSNILFIDNTAIEGGGMYNNGIGGISSPMLNDVRFSSNSASIYGGAMYNDGDYEGLSSPTLTQVVFDDNKADQVGGAMYNSGDNGISSPAVTNAIFLENTAEYGGAIFNDGLQGKSSPTLTGALFRNNDASVLGGAIYNSGEDLGESSPHLVNTTFAENHAQRGGALYNDGTGLGLSSPSLTNVTFSDNQAARGSTIFNNGSDSGVSHPVLSNTIIWDTLASISGPKIFEESSASEIDYSILQDGCATGSVCTHLITADPKLGTLADNGGFSRTMMPGADGSAIDAGNDDPAICPGTDQRGVARPQGAHCDIGAVERQALEDIIFRDGF